MKIDPRRRPASRPQSLDSVWITIKRTCMAFRKNKLQIDSWKEREAWRFGQKWPSWKHFRSGKHPMLVASELRTACSSDQFWSSIITHAPLCTFCSDKGGRCAGLFDGTWWARTRLHRPAVSWLLQARTAAFVTRTNFGRSSAGRTKVI